MTAGPGLRRVFTPDSPRWRRLGAVAVLLCAFFMQCSDLRAELIFRSVERINGAPGWSPVRRYGNPSDIAYPRLAADGAVAFSEEVRVSLIGEITRRDAEDAMVMAVLITSGRQTLADNRVRLAGNGGDIDAAMAVGRLLRKLGVFTFVNGQDQCFSACVFAFMGGQRRSVEGRLGIHRPFFPFTENLPDRQAQFRHLQKVLRDYVEELDFPSSLYEAIMLVPPQLIQIVAPADLKRFYLDGISPSSEDMEDAAAARRLGLSMVAYLQRKAAAPDCAGSLTGAGRCDASAREMATGGGASNTRAGPRNAPPVQYTPRLARAAADP